MLDVFRQDVKAVRRAVAGRPLYSLAVETSLPVGIAGNTAVFGIVNAVLVGGVPGVTRTERLVEVSRAVHGQWLDMSFPSFEDVRGDGNHRTGGGERHGLHVDRPVGPAVRAGRARRDGRVLRSAGGDGRAGTDLCGGRGRLPGCSSCRRD